MALHGLLVRRPSRATVDVMLMLILMLMGHVACLMGNVAMPVCQKN